MWDRVRIVWRWIRGRWLWIVGAFVVVALSVGAVLVFPGGPSSAERATCVGLRNYFDDLRADVGERTLISDLRQINRAANATDNEELRIPAGNLRWRLQIFWDAPGQVSEDLAFARYSRTLGRMLKECDRLGIPVE